MGRRITLPRGTVVEFDDPEVRYAAKKWAVEYIAGPLPKEKELLDAAEGTPLGPLGGRVVEHEYPVRKFYDVYVYTD